MESVIDKHTPCGMISCRFVDADTNKQTLTMKAKSFWLSSPITFEIWFQIVC